MRHGKGTVYAMELEQLKTFFYTIMERYLHLLELWVLKAVFQCAGYCVGGIHCLPCY